MDKHGKKFQLNLKRQIVTNLCEFFSCVCIVLVCPGAQRFPEFHELVSNLFFNIFSFSLFCMYVYIRGQHISECCERALQHP